MRERREHSLSVQRPSAMGLRMLLLVVALLAFVDAQSSGEGSRTGFSNPHHRKDARYGRPVLAMANSPRCMFKGKPVEDGRTISSPEPCLNCTCSKGILLCYLRTCSTVVAPPGCRVHRKTGTCCPQLDCKGTSSTASYRTERTNEPSYKYRLRQDEGGLFGLFDLDPRTDRISTVTETTRKPPPSPWPIPGKYTLVDESQLIRRPSAEEQSQLTQEEDYVEDELSERNDTSGYCFSKGYKYSEGMAMLSHTKCEYCYCIKGKQMCVRPKCHLNIKGCIARFQSGYTCCPSHYQCENTVDGSVDENLQVTPNGHIAHPIHKVSSCSVDGYDFDVGVAVPSSGHCQTCYCTQMGVVCRRLECSPNVPGCKPVIPEGHCCPTEYKCDERISNDTQVPVSHSTDDFDVTVVASSDSYGSSSQAFETDRTDEIPSATDGHTTISSDGDSDSIPETSSEKQKITIELTEESSLESISVIPEENIAVLVVTTEKDGHSKESPNALDSNETEAYDEETTAENSETTSTSLHRTKLSSTRIPGIKLPQGNHNEEIPRPKLPPKDEVEYSEEDKDTYAYDYVELYDDVSPNTQTFAAFDDYNEPTYGDRLSTQGDKITTLSKKYKPQTEHSTYRTKDQSSFTTTKAEKYIGDSIYRQRPTITENYPLTDSHDENAGQTAYVPAKYTIYSSFSKYTPEPYITDIAATIAAHKEKYSQPYKTIHQTTRQLQPTTKKNSPNYYTESTEIFTEYQDTSTEHVPHTSESSTLTYTGNRRDEHTTLNYKGDQKPTYSANPFETTKSIPKEIADLLWTITQKKNSLNDDSSTETYLSNSNLETISSKAQEAGSSVHLAAPKLIVEETTMDNSYRTTPIETTLKTSPSDLPNLNFKSPEMIFSNHGPSHNRKGSPSSTNEELPVLINNHKNTGTRKRPPMRFRPTPAPPPPETSFVEISNHRPTGSIRRPPVKVPVPPGKFQSQTGYGYRPDYRRPANPHQKLHRLGPDSHPELSEDYEDLYDVEPMRESTSKIYSNVQNTKTSAHDDLEVTEHSDIDGHARNQIKPLEQNGNNSSTVPSESGTKVEGKASESKNSDDIAGRSSAEEIEDRNEIISQTSTQSTPTILTSVPTESTSIITKVYTKSFTDPSTQMYVTPEKDDFDQEGKLFRAEDTNKDSDSEFADHRFSQYGGKPNKRFQNNGGRPVVEKPTPKPIPVPQPPQSEEDSREITDVCFVDGRYYNSGEVIVKSNPCEMCRCFYGHPLCQVQQCPPPPEPSCILEYLPGYCCPRVTCGIKEDSFDMDETKPSSEEIRPPFVPAERNIPTSQDIRSPIIPQKVPVAILPEIRPPLITSDNQWKPLPHGPILRPTEIAPKYEPPVIVKKPLPESSAPVKDPDMSNVPEDYQQDVNKVDIDRMDVDISTPAAEEETTTIIASTVPPVMLFPTTPITAPETTTFEDVFPTTLSGEELVETTLPPATTMESIPQHYPVFNPNATAPEDTTEVPVNKSAEIHDNSSGVRKVLGEGITLPPSKVSLSPLSEEEISTVLPVIQTLPTTTGVTDGPEVELDTFPNVVVGELPAELGGNLKISGCNVYGKYYKINDKVTALSKPCSDCICSPDGIACSATC